MGMISSKIEGDKVVSMKMSAPAYKDVVQTIENNNQLKKYSQYLNDNGFITVKVNLKILHDLCIRIYNRLDLQNPPPELKDFKKNIQFNEDGVTPNFAFLLLGLGIASMSGFFTVREGGLLEKVQNAPKSDAGAQQPNKLDISKPFIEIVFPKILVLTNNNDFIDFLLNDFHPQNQNQMPQNMRQAIDIVLDGVNKNTSKGDVRLANIINLCFNTGLIFGLMNFFMKHDPKNTPIVIAELIAETISSFPDDHCYFSNKSIISFDPNVCDIPKTPEKIEAQKAVACPAAPDCPPQKLGCPAPPVCDTSSNNSTLFMVCGILGLLAFTFFFLYMTAKPKVIRVPMTLTDSE